jgi:hypothetical protein
MDGHPPLHLFDQFVRLLVVVFGVVVLDEESKPITHTDGNFNIRLGGGDRIHGE